MVLWYRPLSGGGSEIRTSRGGRARRKERQVNYRSKGMRRATEDNSKAGNQKRISIASFSSPEQRREEDALDTDGRTPVGEKEKRGW